MQLGASGQVPTSLPQVVAPAAPASPSSDVDGPFHPPSAARQVPRAAVDKGTDLGALTEALRNAEAALAIDSLAAQSSGPALSDAKEEEDVDSSRALQHDAAFFNLDGPHTPGSTTVMWHSRLPTLMQ
eukprot:SAG31_NODE_21211_length_555_cov_0.815789_1_plen_127_part_01